MEDQELLANCPDIISIGSMLKATPAQEGMKRIIYFEASNEALDQQNEVVLQKALKESADYYLKFGNVDIDHYTLLGKPNAKQGRAGIPGCELYEIGKPREVSFPGNRTLVKAEIYSGEGPAAEHANNFWSSLTEVTPPHSWYPSVGGSVLEKAIEVDPTSQMKKAYVTKVRWSNIALSKTPVNANVSTVTAMPLSMLAKSWGAFGIDFGKALEAGYGTDSATLTDGAALRGANFGSSTNNYFDFRNKLSDQMLHGAAGHNPSTKDLVAYCKTEFGLSLSEATEWVERFMRDLKSVLYKRSKQ